MAVVRLLPWQHSEFPSISHHQIKVGIVIYRGTDSCIVIYELIFCDLGGKTSNINNILLCTNNINKQCRELNTWKSNGLVDATTSLHIILGCLTNIRHYKVPLVQSHVCR